MPYHNLLQLNLSSGAPRGFEGVFIVVSVLLMVGVPPTNDVLKRPVCYRFDPARIRCERAIRSAKSVFISKALLVTHQRVLSLHVFAPLLPRNEWRQKAVPCI